uniref:Uncharacterized protein n=1 Tax=Strigamia maritima TaxID=126957 RepID=T1JGQ6_STRMM
MAMPVSVSVEVAIENHIQEISYDGQEVFVQPLSMSENLSKLAQKIDFKTDDDNNKASELAEGAKEDDESKEIVPFQQPIWPNSLTEVSVLLDVLNVAKEKRYLVLDPVTPDVSVEPKPLAQLYAKKKSLAGAANILLNGAERLRTCQMEMSRNRNVPDFHLELLRLRQNWRLKKVGTTILGDLSYKTAGSRFWQNGVFEVTKSEESNASPPPSPNNYGVGAPRLESALKVTVPSELEGISYIQVTIQKDQENLCSARLTIPNPQSGVNNSEGYWQQKLEAAQNVLFCKELFAQLAREAVQLQAPIPHMVVSNQITASLFPGIQLIVGLCHSSSQEKKKPDHNHVLEHSLHQLLREVHHNTMHHPMPHPATAMLGVSKRRRLAGPEAFDRHALLEMTKSETLLEQIIKQAQHVVLRLRTMYVIDTLAREIKDPLIVAHWNCLNSPTQSCVKINIVTHGYETVCRTSLIVHVREKTLKAICRDGKVMQMSYEPQELRDLILCQISQHQVTAVQALSKLMGWQILASSNNLGIGPVEPLGNASSVVMASPSGDRVIILRCGPNTSFQVFIQSSPRKDFYPSQLVKDMRWENLGGNSREIRWDKMEGRNFLNRVEMLMASLTSC